jgi:hypothetical protein
MELCTELCIETLWLAVWRIAAWGSTSSGSVTDQPSGAPPSIAARALVSLLCEGFEKTMT